MLSSRRLAASIKRAFRQPDVANLAQSVFFSRAGRKPRVLLDCDSILQRCVVESVALRRAGRAEMRDEPWNLSEEKMLGRRSGARA